MPQQRSHRSKTGAASRILAYQGDQGQTMSADVLPMLREAFSQRPEWREFSPRQLSVLLYLHGYVAKPPRNRDVEAALPLALRDLDPDHPDELGGIA